MKSSLLWFQILNSSHLLRNYHLSSSGILSKNILNYLKSLLKYPCLTELKIYVRADFLYLLIYFNFIHCNTLYTSDIRIQPSSVKLDYQWCQTYRTATLGKTCTDTQRKCTKNNNKKETKNQIYCIQYTK